jgi:energy-coupling factor transport system ATP-binding protein
MARSVAGASGEAPATDPPVSISGLTYAFGRTPDDDHHTQPVPVLQDIDLEIAPGDFVVITGPSGCGKSTLALAIGGYLFQQYQGSAQGAVVVGGKDAQQTPVYEMAEIVGLVQQNPEAQLCTLTVEDEIAFGLENHRVPPSEIDIRVNQALEMVNAVHLRNRALRTLSGGEKQRVAIAAVLALEPRLLILDEPTSSLDPTATAAVFEVIKEIRAATGITVIVIEHKLAYLMAFEPRVVRMRAGRIVSDRIEGGSSECVGEPMISTGEPVAFTGEPVAFTGEPVAFTGEPVAFTGARPTIGPTRSSTIRSEKPIVAVSHLDVELDGRRALSEVSLELWPGEFTVVMGDNGSGKSTLLWTLLGLRKPTRGHVTIMDMDTAKTPVSTLAAHVGFVFQNPDHQIFAKTVWDEAAIAPRNLHRMDKAVAERIRNMLARAGLADRHADHPYRLSYGEKRRLNLISVLGLQPRLLLLDEILIGQDVENIRYILSVLQTAVARGTTVLMVNHHPEIVRQVATRLLFLEEGKLAIDAPTEEAMQQLARSGHTAYLPPSFPRRTKEPSSTAIRASKMNLTQAHPIPLYEQVG